MFPDRVTRYKHKLNDTEIEILRYLLQKRKVITLYTIKEIAQDNYVSINTVVRFAKKLGYDNFTDLKYAIYYSTLNLEQNIAYDKTEHNSSNNSFKIVKKTSDILDENELIEIAHDIFLSNECYAFGIGDSEYFSELLSKNILAAGKKITVLNKMYEVENVIDDSSKSDLVIFVSAGGETREVLMMLEKCISKELNVVAITSNKESTLYRKVSKKILFDYSLKVKRGVNISDLTGMMYAIMRFVYIYWELFMDKSEQHHTKHYK